MAFQKKKKNEQSDYVREKGIQNIFFITPTALFF